MPIIPQSTDPLFGADNFNSTQGVTIVGAFNKLFDRLPSTTLTKAECESVFNNREDIIT